MLKRNLNRNAANIIRKAASHWPPENDTFEHSKKNHRKTLIVGYFVVKMHGVSAQKSTSTFAFLKKKLSE